MSQQTRQLAAILFTDIVGYTAMMQQDENQAVAIVKRYIGVLQSAVDNHSGKILNDYGDGSLCSFSSATEAVRCAIELQQQLQSGVKVPLRLGLHVGEIFFEGEKVLGDGVNVASRIQSLGQEKAVLFSKEVFDKIKNQPEFKCVSLGTFEFKNVDDKIEVFATVGDGLIVPKKEQMRGKIKERQQKSMIKKWTIAAAIMGLLAASFFAYKRFLAWPQYNGSDKSIAVLPFENVGAPGGEDFISDGITQDIINNLSKVSSLEKVIAWFSVRKFKKTTESPQQIASELNVAAILTGTIQREADNLHIIAQLIDVNTSKILWGEDYIYPNKDILIIQSKVAQLIVNALKASLTPQEQKGLSTLYTKNVEAYKYYIRGRTFWNARNPENYDSAEANYKKAISLDSNYALAYAGIADCYTYNLKGIPQLHAIPIALAFTNKALALDSNLSEGLTTLGFIQFNFEFNWNESKKTLQKALSLDPNNSPARMYYGIALQYAGDTENGLKECRKAVSLDPFAFPPNWVLGRNLYFARRYDESIAQFEKAKSVAPKNNEFCFWSEALAYVEMKMNNEALKQMEEIPPTAVNKIDNVDLLRAYIFARVGQKTRAKELLERTVKRDLDAPPYRIALIYVALGENEAALNWLEEGYRIHGLHMFFAGVDPALDPLRNDPRFISLLSKMNLHN